MSEVTFRSPRPDLVAFVAAEEFRRGARVADNGPIAVTTVTVIEEESYATVYLPAIAPTEVRAAVDRAAAEGAMARLTGKIVNIVSTDPALVAAFVYAAKPWLRWFSVNGRAVVPAPEITRRTP